MQIDWTTFALEALNFLLLVWLLKRFLYRPVLATIEARRAQTAKTIEQAESVRRDAEKLKSDYQAHLATVEKERAAAKDRLDAEFAAERTRQLTQVQAEVAEERRRREAMEARERNDAALALEREAKLIAARFATRFLERLSGPELETKLVDLALNDLDAQAPLEALRTVLKEPALSVNIVSAYPLDEARRAAFAQALGRLAGRTLAPTFVEDSAIKAGICIHAGSWVMMANLRDELSFFATAFEHGR